MKNARERFSWKIKEEEFEYRAKTESRGAQGAGVPVLGRLGTRFSAAGVAGEAAAAWAPLRELKFSLFVPGENILGAHQGERRGEVEGRRVWNGGREGEDHEINGPGRLWALNKSSPLCILLPDHLRFEEEQYREFGYNWQGTISKCWDIEPENDTLEEHKHWDIRYSNIVMGFPIPTYSPLLLSYSKFMSFLYNRKKIRRPQLAIENSQLKYRWK